MRIPYSWLKEWIEIPWDAKELGSRLTLAGFELDALEPAAPAFTGVIVAEIVSAERHPQADKLRLCQVSTGRETMQIVCGAANARAGMKSALATVGAKLPGDVEIRAATLRGVSSQGMLASAKELGLAETSSGILELPDDAPVGVDLRKYLDLDDPVLDLAVTPNRGDAMSVIGIAREVAALTGHPLGNHEVAETRAGQFRPARTPLALLQTLTPDHQEVFPVYLDAPAGCPTFAGCVVRRVNNRTTTPILLRERLRRAGVRSISPLVDVTNYVMLELGQPMHAYDLAKLRGEIRVRMAREGESLTLLDGKTIQTQSDVLLITDKEGPIGAAGIMGGERTAVSAETTEVFFESAYFAPDAVIGRGRRWGLVTDASQRFERGVDPSQQGRGAGRAVGLLRSFAGGLAGPVHVVRDDSHQPLRRPVILRRSQLRRLLGAEIPDQRVADVLTSLEMNVTARAGEGWQATPPAHRFDITIEADLIEEVARIHGFASIPETQATGPHRFRGLPEAQPLEHLVLEALAMRGYEEAITFSFVDPALQSRLFPDRPNLALSNPIASDMSVMRVSLWPGLVRAAQENHRRQQDRIRLFEHATRFEVIGEGQTREIDTLSAIAFGTRLPEQWGIPREDRVPVDFYDVKGDLEAVLAATGALRSFTFEAPSASDGPAAGSSGDTKPGGGGHSGAHRSVSGDESRGALACLHPGRQARILRDGREVGRMGELHPSLVKALDFTYAPVLFELEMAALGVVRPQYREISRFPQVRRDLAVVIDEDVPLSALAERVTLAATSLLQTFRIFDVYRGPGVETGRKSVAFGLIFQDISRTLTDDDIERLIASIVADLRKMLNAEIRE